MLQLNIGSSEWGIIFLLLLLLIVGSNKLSGLARLLGRATGEYEKAKELIQDEKENPRSTDSIISVPRILGPVGSEREKLETIAKALGVEQGELTEDQLRSLISQKIQKR